MKLMMTLSGDEPTDSIDSIGPIDAYLASQPITLLAAERLDPDEVATITETDDAPAVVARTGSALRAWWLIDVPTRAAANQLAQDAPGTGGTLELHEAWTPQDFGAPADAPTPQPPPVRPGHHRYAAFVDRDLASDASDGRPTEASMAMMDAYMAPLAEAGTILDGVGLKGTTRSTRFRRAAAQRIVRDGPFTEAKELIGGYMIVQARTLDEAVDLIRPWLRINRTGQARSSTTIEVRRLS
ncbi:MAG TPA: YciI family protein [Kofleriaceae bacterium]|nr:YciI family protein [Kofleriaceae bacterium]